MFAAQLLNPTASLSPLGAMLSIAFLGAVLLASQVPPLVLKRLGSALVLAVVLAVTTVPQMTTNLIIQGLECCELWFLVYFICWPPSWGC